MKREKKKSLTETEPRNNAVSEQTAEGVELGKPETVRNSDRNEAEPRNNAVSGRQTDGVEPEKPETADEAKRFADAAELKNAAIRDAETSENAPQTAYAAKASAQCVCGPREAFGAVKESGADASGKGEPESDQNRVSDKIEISESAESSRIADADASESDGNAGGTETEPLFKRVKSALSKESFARAGKRFSEAFSKESFQRAGKRFVGAFSKQNVKNWAKRWFIDAFSGMALGLFATLIAGTIFAQIGTWIGDNAVGRLVTGVAAIAKNAMGAGIGAGMAYMLKTDKLTMFSCIVAGLVGANYATPEFFTVGAIAVGIGNPIGAYLTTIFTIEVCKRVAGKTRLDIILVPLSAMAVTALVAFLLCPPASWLVQKIAEGIEIATAWSPFLMGIVISVVMGILLTMPTSSAAIWVTIAANNTSPVMLLAGGAAVVGCAAHMIGFAVMSYRENRFGGLIAQGLGTSMLQIPNIMRKPVILVPPIVASAVVGPLATCVFRLKCGAAGGGMGTAGLVGLFSTIEYSNDIPVYLLVLGIVFCFFVLPAVVSWAVCALFKKLGWIKPEDLTLSL